MTGGIVTNTKLGPKSILIEVVEDRGASHHEVSTSITPAARCIEEGDSIFWNNSCLFWSPRTRCWRDYKLDKLSERVLTKETKGEKVKIGKEED